MNRGTIRAQVQTALRETLGVRYTSEELDEYIDDGYRDVANRTGCLVATVNLSCPARQPLVDLPADCLYPIAFRDVATGQPVDACHWNFIDGEDQFFIRAVGTYPELAAAWGLKKLLLYPAYQALGSLEMSYARSPVDGFAGDGSSPEYPDGFHVGLVHYAHFRALVRDADERRLYRALRQKKAHEEVVKQIEEWTESRHEGVLSAIYGESFRTPIHTWTILR